MSVSPSPWSMVHGIRVQRTTISTTAALLTSPKAVSAMVRHIDLGTPWHSGSTGTTGMPGSGTGIGGSLTPPGAGAPASDHDIVVDRSRLPSASVTIVSIAPDCSEQVPATHSTSISVTGELGSDLATDAMASSHREAGMPSQDTTG